MAAATPIDEEKQVDANGCRYDTVSIPGDIIYIMGLKCQHVPKNTFLYRGSTAAYEANKSDVDTRSFAYFTTHKLPGQLYGQTLQYKLHTPITVLMIDEPSNAKVLSDLYKYIIRNKKTEYTFNDITFRNVNKENVKKFNELISKMRSKISIKQRKARKGKDPLSMIEDLDIVKGICTLNGYIGTPQLISGFATNSMCKEGDESCVTVHSELMCCMPSEYVEYVGKCECEPCKTEGYSVGAEQAYLNQYIEQFSDQTNIDENIEYETEVSLFDNLPTYVDPEYALEIHHGMTLEEIYDTVYESLTEEGRRVPNILPYLLLLPTETIADVDLWDKYADPSEEFTREKFLSLMDEMMIRSVCTERSYSYHVPPEIESKMRKYHTPQEPSSAASSASSASAGSTGRKRKRTQRKRTKRRRKRRHTRRR